MAYVTGMGNICNRNREIQKVYLAKIGMNCIERMEETEGSVGASSTRESQ